MRDTKILIALTILAGVFTKSLFSDDTFEHELLEFIGYILVTVCAVGRIYCTAFIGGIKNEKLIMVGPYSMHRNPLYFYSLLGAVGIGIMSTHLSAFLVIFAGFYFIYQGLINREEEFLKEKFGAEFEDYKKRVPKLVPNPKLYTCPDELLFQPKFLSKAVFDAIWWFVPYMLFELADALMEAGIIKPLFTVF